MNYNLRVDVDYLLNTLNRFHEDISSSNSRYYYHHQNIHINIVLRDVNEIIGNLKDNEYDKAFRNASLQLSLLPIRKQIFDYNINHPRHREHFTYIKDLYEYIETFFKEIIYIHNLPSVYELYMIEYNALNSNKKQPKNIKISNFIEFINKILMDGKLILTTNFAHYYYLIEYLRTIQNGLFELLSYIHSSNNKQIETIINILISNIKKFKSTIANKADEIIDKLINNNLIDLLEFSYKSKAKSLTFSLKHKSSTKKPKSI